MRLGRLLSYSFDLFDGAGDRNAPAFRTVFKGQDQFNRLVSLAQSNDWKSLPIGERTAVVGQALTGTRYKSYTLEIDNRIESPSVNFNGLDAGRFLKRHWHLRGC